MKYKYTATPIFDERNRIVKRPMIEVELREGNKKIKALGLIDSGSDNILINSQYADSLGIVLDNTKSVDIVGISGTKNKCYLSKLTFKVDGFSDDFSFPVAFIDSDSVGILLGQTGFFDTFRIKFEKDHDSFELSLPKT